MGLQIAARKTGNPHHPRPRQGRITIGNSNDALGSRIAPPRRNRPLRDNPRKSCRAFSKLDSFRHQHSKSALFVTLERNAGSLKLLNPTRPRPAKFSNSRASSNPSPPTPTKAQSRRQLTAAASPPPSPAHAVLDLV